MTEHLKLIKPGPEPQGGRFVMTETAQDIFRSLRLVQDHPGGAATMIAAAPGMGKTEALLQFVQTARRTHLVTCVAGEASIFNLTFSLMKHLDLGDPNSNRLPAERERIAEKIGAGGMLIMDEAQNLVLRAPKASVNYDALEWLRAMAEEGGLSLVYCGDLKLMDAMTHLPQLKSRLRRPVVVRQVSKADVQSLAASRGLTDDRVTESLYLVAKHHGALRDVVNVIDHARLFARGGTVDLGHIVAAIEDLKLTPKGARQ